MIDYNVIGGRLQAKRRSAGLTQCQLARQAGISSVYLSRIESGAAKPTLEALGTLASALGMDVGGLLCSVDSDSPTYGIEEYVEAFRALPPEARAVVVNIVRAIGQMEF